MTFSPKILLLPSMCNNEWTVQDRKDKDWAPGKIRTHVYLIPKEAWLDESAALNIKLWELCRGSNKYITPFHDIYLHYRLFWFLAKNIDSICIKYWFIIVFFSMRNKQLALGESRSHISFGLIDTFISNYLRSLEWRT